jgi:hypothetical protein
LASLALCVSVATTPAFAAHGGGFRNGFGDGGGFHDGFRGRGFRGGFGAFDAYYGDYGYGGYGYDYEGYGSCFASQPAYDRSGRLIGRAPVNNC